MVLFEIVFVLVILFNYINLTHTLQTRVFTSSLVRNIPMVVRC